MTNLATLQTPKGFPQGFETLHLGTNPQDAKYVLIVLHGLGAGRYDLAPICTSLEFSGIEDWHFVLPQAPDIAVSCNHGAVMPSWYDVFALGGNRDSSAFDQQGLDQSNQHLHQIINYFLEAGIEAKNIVLLGFSQGGSLAVKSALSFNHTIGGLWVCSGFVAHPLNDEPLSQSQQSIPTHWCHGRQDEVVPLSFANQGIEALIKKGLNVQTHFADCGHTIAPEHFFSLRNFLAQITMTKSTA